MSTVQVTRSASLVQVTATRPQVAVGVPSVLSHNDLLNRSTADAHPASAVTNTPAGAIAATTVQAAINELDAKKVAGASSLTTAGTLLAVASAGTVRHATAAEVVASLGMAAMTAGALAVAASATAFAPLAHPAAAGQLLTSSAGTALAWSGTGFTYASDTLALIGAGGITSRQAATQDGVQLLGRAGGTSSYLSSIVPGTLTGNHTLTTPNASGTLALTSDLSAYQPLDSDLTAIAGLATTAFGRGVLPLADAAALASYAGIPLLATTGITGALTLSKSGTTARTVTFQDAAYTVAGTNLDNAFSVAQTIAGSVPGAPSAGQVLIGGGALKAGGAITFTNGSAAAPGIGTADFHGLYRVSSTSLGFTVAGTAAATLTSAGAFGATSLTASASTGAGLTVSSTQASTSTITGSAIFGGGIGVAGRVSLGGDLYCAGILRSDGTGARNALVATGGNANIQWYFPASGAMRIFNSAGNGIDLLRDAAGSADGGQLGVYGIANFNNTTDASAIGTAAIVGLGGASIAKSLWCGGTINIANATGELRINGTKVVSARGAAVVDATDAASAITQLNALLARCRAHGLIA